ncbi:MAG: glycosyltransferase [Leptolyngbyaceae bacterium]|nr:glycosyltransferase [Leptolyngbyaceae bacterium]
MKVALVHDYLTQLGGAERVFELLCRFVPQGDIFTSVYDPEKTIDLNGRSVHTTFLQQVPGAVKNFRLFAPFYYPAFRSLNLQDYDLILSSTATFAKGVRKRPDATHICFCHNVTRFLWDTKTYLNQYTNFKPFQPIINPIFEYLKAADLHYAKGPDLYIANSTIVEQRIREIYKQPAITVNYPIDSQRFQFCDQKSDFYLVASRLISYKRIDIVVEAFNWLGWPLLIIGNGPEREHLEAMALPNIKFLGHVSDAERCQLMAKARSMIVTALEDYGLVPIEANFSGTPVVAYGAGGVLDTQVPGETGVLFSRQTPESIFAALQEAHQTPWNYAAIRQHALERFTDTVFYQKIETILEQQGFTGILHSNHLSTRAI